MGLPRTFNTIDLKRCLFNMIYEQKFFMEKIVESNPSNFLEIGSGWGAMALTVEDLTNANGICTDYDLKDYNIFTEISSFLDTKIKFINSDIKSLDFNNNSFDLIYSREFLTHITSPQDILNKAYNWLSPKGKFIFQVAYHYKESENKPIVTTGHFSDFKCNGFNESSFESINNGLFDFKYFKVGKRDYKYDPCDLCDKKRKNNHCLKLIGIGNKKSLINIR